MFHDAGRKVALGRILVALSAVAWSTAGIFTKGVEADVWTVLLWRGLLAGAVMSAWLGWRRGRAGLTDWQRLGWAGWSAATVSSAATICFIAAFKNTAVANVAIVYAAAPFAAAGIAWAWMRETPGLATLVAAGLCLSGVTVMVGGSAGSPDLVGDLLALGMTALMALMMVIMRRHPDRPMTLAVGPVSCVQLVAVAWTTGAHLDVAMRELVLLAGFGVVHAAATVLLTEGVLRIRAAEAALLGALEVPLAPLWSWLLLSETLRMPTFVGGAVVLATLAWYLGRETRARA
ncbi:MAG: DMT family transporter [Boseongicola sp. SB0673_bin_14]|nr:DMT family transporter [Boseongicola sp. SB0667_bin_21]MYI70203.1 DMT family transporter [Boseongicola sp. SB0673_bin_14]